MFVQYFYRICCITVHYSLMYFIQTQDVLNVKPSVTNSTVIRELAAILRSDLSLIISRHECKLLTDAPLNVPAHKLHYFPFAYGEENKKAAQLEFSKRQHFVMLVCVCVCKHK